MEEATERPGRMVGVNVPPQAGDFDELADLLEEIARKLRGGFTCGYYPHWSTQDEEAKPS
jgi:hypothetical protein